MKYLTITLNPALDKTYFINGNLSVGELNRVNDVTIDFGGKGINVSKAISKLGGDTYAVCVLGGNTGNELEKRILKTKINLLKIDNGNFESRTNLSIIGDKTTEINEPGPILSDKVLNKVFSTIKSNIDDQTVVTINGSLPKNCSIDVYKKIISIAKEKNAITVLDCDGKLLKELIGLKPDIIKPNRKELEDLLNCSINYINDALEYIKEFSIKNEIMVLATFDSTGSIFCDKYGNASFVESYKIEAKGVKGAGDTFLGAFLWAKYNKKCSIEDCLKIASSAACALLTKGDSYPTKEELLKKFKPEKEKI